MKFKIVITAILLFLLLLVTTPVRADEGSSAVQEQSQSLKTYFLTALPGGSKREINLDPPATKLVISSGSGDTAIRCGDGIHNYSCAPGKRIEITTDSATPIEKIWAENPHESQVRLRIDIYGAAQPIIEEDLS